MKSTLLSLSFFLVAAIPHPLVAQTTIVSNLAETGGSELPGVTNLTYLATPFATDNQLYSEVSGSPSIFWPNQPIAGPAGFQPARPTLSNSKSSPSPSRLPSSTPDFSLSSSPSSAAAWSKAFRMDRNRFFRFVLRLQRCFCGTDS